MKIAFVVSEITPYDQAMASTRLRAHDVIKYLNSNGVEAEFYVPDTKYDIVIFQKTFDEEYVELCEQLKQQGAKVMLDMNVNLLDLSVDSEVFTEEEKQARKKQQSSLLRMIDRVDLILVASEYLQRVYSEYKDTFVIEENISDIFFSTRKIHTGNKDIKLLYSGYARKAVELKLIESVLVRLHAELGVKLLFVSDSDPQLNIIPYEVVFYGDSTLTKPELFIDADIKIAPRDLSIPYNLGHTINKVAYPMALSIPAVASPVPSYLNRGVLICEGDEQWYSTLKRLIINSKLRQFYGDQAREIVQMNLNMDFIGNLYIRLFEQLLDA